MQVPTRRIDLIVFSIAIVVFVVSVVLGIGGAAWEMMLGPCGCTILYP